MKVRLVFLSKLKAHERTSPIKTQRLIKRLKKEKLRHPVMVDQKTKIILDGHHRAAAYRLLGRQKIPAYLVNYSDRRIKVYWRRPNKNTRDIKKAVLIAGLSGRLLAPKSTRHSWGNLIFTKKTQFML